MSTGFSELPDDGLTQALAELLELRLKDAVASRAAGHCMRVADLDTGLMAVLCRALRKELPQAQVFVLTEGNQTAEDDDLFVSSTKLVELRNPLPDGTLRPPLLVFVPANLRTSAEDSFGVATFEEIVVTDVYQELVTSLLARVPVSLQGHVRDLLAYLTQEDWSWADPVAQARFLLTAIRNDVDGESLGAAVYELGLVPDFKLFDDPSVTHGRIRKNLEAVQKLTYSDSSVRGRVTNLGLTDKAVQRSLMHILVEMGVEDPRAWTRHIVTDRSNWTAAFDKWQFEEAVSPDKVAVHIAHTDLPIIADNEPNERLQGLVGQQVLALEDRTSFKVVFGVDPHPTRVQGLHHFSVQVLARDGGAVGAAKNVKAWKGAKTSHTVTLSKLNKIDFDEGWHYVRILPWTEGGDPIPMLDAEGGAANAGLPLNESEPFYVLRGESVDETPTQRTMPQEYSVEHARVKMQLAAVLEGRDPQTDRPEVIGWADRDGKNRNAPHDLFAAKLGRGGAFHVLVPRILKELEQGLLLSPERPVGWSLRIVEGRTEVRPGDAPDWATTAATGSFLAARARYFETVRSESKDLVSQAADFLALKDACAEYAGAYLDLLADLRSKIEGSTGTDQQRAIVALRTALGVDTVRVLITDFRGRTREAAFVGPTHPLRALWLATWAQLAQHWVSAAKDGPDEYVAPVREALLEKLLPLNVPAMLALSEGRVFTTVDNLHPFWELYASATEQDPRGLLGDICAALGIAEPAIGGTVVTGEVLASRIRRYLIQHPYVRTLKINVFNPGRAGVLADALVWLQRQGAFEELRYDIRLMVPDPESPNVGEAIEQLLSSSGNTSSGTAEAFSAASGSHLFPKLSLAVHSVSDFSSAPEDYPAHISVLFDLFPAEEIGVDRALHPRGVAPLHGLVQGFATSFRDDEDGTYWRRQLRHGTARGFPPGSDLTELLWQLPQAISGSIATVATGSPAFERRPTLTLGLDVGQRDLLHSVHELSDWVFTIDQNLGIEFFDRRREGEREDYLIDYVPDATTSFGHRLFTTSRSLSELESTLRSLLQQYGLQADDGVDLIMDQLRALSGRLALKLISSPTQQAEALGLALARLFLEHQEALSNQIVMPLDAHLDLFQSIKKQAATLGDSINLQRTDLALFDLNAATRTISCNLVEVKCYTQVGGVGAYNQLKEGITQQILQSERVLQRHFDPSWKSPDRPDRLLKTQEFSYLLEFYLDRSIRYGFIDDQVAEEARNLLGTLEDGYTLRFSRSALIFDFEKPGTESPEHEVGIEFHRIGYDLVRALIAEANAPNAPSVVEGQQQPSEGTSIPRVPTAAFIAPDRDRSTSQSELEDGEGKPLTTREPVEAPVSGVDDERSQSGADQASDLDDGYEGSLRVGHVVSSADQHLDEDGSPMDLARNGPDEATRSDDPPTSSRAVAKVDDADKAAGPPYDVMLGGDGSTPQYGILGELSGRKVGLDLNQTHTISLFGVQGAGKSYTLGSVIEMACLDIANINLLPAPLATVVFHYSPTQDYKPEFTSMVNPNSDPAQLALLRERYGAEPSSLEDVLMLVPAARLDELRSEYPSIDVQPIAFAASELSVMHWKFLMGAVGSQSMYLRQINLIMRGLRDTLTLHNIRQGIDSSTLSGNLKDLARSRLQFAAEYIDDSRRLADMIRPGRLIIVDLRDELMEKDEALGLFAVLLQIISEATYEHRSFNKLVVFDEAHKYMQSPDLVAGLIEVVREMRHRGTSIVLASQDPPSVPASLVELSSQIILHRFNSPAWLKHIQKANAALNGLTPEKMSSLGPGEAYVWTSKATDDAFTKSATKIQCRPRVTQHGGGTRTAIPKDHQG